MELNSKMVEKGGLFIALSGKKQDGKKYIPDAIAKGASVIVYDGEFDVPQNSAVVFVKTGGDMRENIAKMAANFYPQIPTLVSAITGTNGKTSIADFTRQMMSVLCYKSS